MFNWKSFLYYRTQFFFYLVYAAVSPLASLLFVYVVYSVSAGVPGWSFYQLLFLSGVVGMLSSLVPYICNPSGLVYALRYGTFEVFLTRPYSAFTALMANYGDTTNIAGIIDEFLLVVYAALHLQVTFIGVAMTAIVFILGTIIVTMLMQAIVMLTYRAFRTASVTMNFFNTFMQFGSYPLSIYGFTATIIFTILIPVGFATYYPAELLTGKAGTEIFIFSLIGSLIIMGVLYSIIAKRLKSYVSAMG